MGQTTVGGWTFTTQETEEKQGWTFTKKQEPVKAEPTKAKKKKRNIFEIIGEQSLNIPSVSDPIAMAEGLASVASGVAAFPTSIAASAAFMAPRTGGVSFPPAAAEAMGQDVGGAITYKPKSEGGQALAESIGTVFRPIDEAVQFAAKTAFPKDPDGQAVVRTALGAALVASPFVLKWAKGKLASGRGLVVSEMKDAIKKSTDMPEAMKSTVLDKIDVPKSALDIVKEKIEGAKALTPEQKKMYTAERGERIAKAVEARAGLRGEEAIAATKGQMKGRMKRVDFESIADKVADDVKNTMRDKITDSPAISEFEKFSAWEGLEKLFGKEGLGIPATHELDLMGRVFGQGFVKSILDKRSAGAKFKDAVLEVMNVPRTLMSSFDLSFGFRQGVFAAFSYPGEFMSAFAKQFKYFAKEKHLTALQESIVADPMYKYARNSGLKLTEIGARMALREEPMMGSLLAEKIPGIGQGVRMSNRAYTGMANKLRFDLFKRFVEHADKEGLNPLQNGALLHDISGFTNTITGRGGLGALEKHASALNAMLFSPRLLSSRLTMLNPVYYTKWGGMHPFVRKQALGSLFRFVGAGSALLGAFKAYKAVRKDDEIDVGLDPSNSDFGKVKIGNTRLDIWGGFQQYVRSGIQLGEYFGKSVQKAAGKDVAIKQSGLDIISRQLLYKQAPVASFFTDALRGKTLFGEDLTAKNLIAERFIPLLAQDFMDLMKDDNDFFESVIMIAPAIFGFGMQTYADRGTGKSPEQQKAMGLLK